MYSETDHIDVEGTIKYRDGKEQVIKTTLKVVSIDEGEGAA